MLNNNNRVYHYYLIYTQKMVTSLNSLTCLRWKRSALFHYRLLINPIQLITVDGSDPVFNTYRFGLMAIVLDRFFTTKYYVIKFLSMTSKIRASDQSMKNIDILNYTRFIYLLLMLLWQKCFLECQKHGCSKFHHNWTWKVSSYLFI